MGFLSAGMLWWLAGAIIPIALHWIRPRRPPEPIVPWGAMAFLRAAETQKPRLSTWRAWRRLQRWLSLACRVALIALLALAAARPYSRLDPDDSEQPVTRLSSANRDLILIFDVSASMGLRDDEGRSALERATSWARDRLARLTPGDSATLAAASASGRLTILSGPDHLPQSPDQGSSDIPSALAAALELGPSSPIASRDREIIVLTDLQARAWSRNVAGSWPTFNSANMRVVDVGAGARPVPAIESLTLRPETLTAGQSGSAFVNLFNPDAAPRSVAIELLSQDGRSIAGPPQRLGPIPPGGRLTARLTFRAQSVGVQGLIVRLVVASVGGPDAQLYAFDRAAAIVQTVAPPAILLVDGDPHPEPLRGETDFLRLALTQDADEPPLVQLRTVSGSDWDPADLQGRDAVILADPPALLDRQAQAIRGYLDAGGALLVWLGNRADPAALQIALGGRLPADDGEPRGDLEAKDPEATPRARLAEFLDVGSTSESLTSPADEPRLFAWRRLKLWPEARVLARLSNGDPWIAERSVGLKGGKTIELAGSLDASGGTLPAHPDFVPLAHSLIRALTKPRIEVAEVKPGSLARLDVGPSAIDGPIAVAGVGPGGKAVEAKLTPGAGRTRLDWDQPARVGAYRFDLPDGPRWVVVPPDPDEMNPIRLKETALQDWAERLSLRFETEDGRILAEPQRDGADNAGLASRSIVSASSRVGDSDSRRDYEWAWLAFAFSLTLLALEAALRDFGSTGLGKSHRTR